MGINTFNEDTAAVKIQRLFRERLTTDECVISGRRFLARHAIVLDKQLYDARELYKNLSYSTEVPHSRRRLTSDEMECIFAKFDPFDLDAHTTVHLCKVVREPLTPRSPLTPLRVPFTTPLRVNYNLLDVSVSML